MPQDTFKQAAISTLDLATAPQETINKTSEVCPYKGKITIGYYDDCNGPDTRSETLEDAIATLKESGKTLVTFTKEEAPDHGGLAIDPSYFDGGYEWENANTPKTSLFTADVNGEWDILLPIKEVVARLGEKNFIILPYRDENWEAPTNHIFKISDIKSFSLDPDEAGFLSIGVLDKESGKIWDYAIADTAEARHTMTENLLLIQAPANQQEPAEQ